MRVADMPADPRRLGKHIKPETGIWPTCEWGYECQRGFVSDSRFGGGTVIKRTNRQTTRRWLNSARAGAQAAPEGVG